jgi:lambda repressor-like predicted transcriptional regulator
MYPEIRLKIIAKYGSINQLAMHIGVNNSDLYSAFRGKKPMYPKYRKLIAEALGEPEESLFKEANQ